MSLSSEQILARLEELKRWQEVQMQRCASDATKAGLDFSDIVSPVPHDRRTPSRGTNIDSIDTDAPSVQRNEGDRSNGHDEPEGQRQAARPFLRKGTGLAKYRMSLDDTKAPYKANRHSGTNKSARKCTDRAESTPARPPPPPSPLPRLVVPKVDFVTKPKGLWTDVTETETNKSKLPAVAEDDGIVSQINKIVSSNEAVASNADPTDESKLLAEIQRYIDQQRSPPYDRELLAFEALERKATHSSFCSTNSSVAYLLAMQCSPSKGERQSLDVDVSPNTTIHSDDVKDDGAVVYDDRDRWSTTDDDDDDDTQSVAVRIIVDAETMTDRYDRDDDEVRLLHEEIQVFRAENSRLVKAKLDVEREVRELRKHNRQLEEDKLRVERKAKEERTKLTKEKTVFDRYVKDMKDKPNKKEREEMSLLRNELSAAREELKLKESRHGAAQARLRTQIKHLEKEKDALIAEQELLRKQNGRLVAAQKSNRTPTDTKILHQINKKLTALAQDPAVAIVGPKKDKTCPVVVAPSRTTYDEEDDETCSNNSAVPASDNYTPYDMARQKENDRNVLNLSSGDGATFKNIGDIERDYEKMFSRTDSPLRGDCPSLEDNHRRERKERYLDDGSREITYPNGNVKTISPDGSCVKMLYYNGDTKHTDLTSGTIDYLYAETRVQHLTYADGTEVLNFPDGRCEKRYEDGSYEVASRDGFERKVMPDGKEDTTYPDGTRISVSRCGDEKVVELPNGQRIVHTREHKRREYPDGTVNILYPDGLLETRYTNGRVRLKDSHGRLIRDSSSDLQ